MWPSFSLHSFYRAGPVSRLHFHHLIADPLRLTTAFLSKKNWHHYWSHTFHFPLSVPLTKMMVVCWTNRFNLNIGDCWFCWLQERRDIETNLDLLWDLCSHCHLKCNFTHYRLFTYMTSSFFWEWLSKVGSFYKRRFFYMCSKNDCDLKKSGMKTDINQTVTIKLSEGTSLVTLWSYTVKVKSVDLWGTNL